MGTKFRTMLAPIGLSTGDGRRFAVGGISLADLPMPFEWARTREGGHDGAISVGSIKEATVLSVKDAVKGEWISADAVKGMDSAMTAVWARGEMYDDADREVMPRLAEDVAEAMHLMAGGTLGPSVDLDSFEGVPVLEGTDEPVTWEIIEEYYEEHGEEPKLELLITEGRVRAATLVSIPAFAETSRPLELLPAEDGEAAATTEELAALIASTATDTRPSVAAFDLPQLAGPTPITFDWDKGLVFGHIATWKTCHVGYADVCVTAPKDEAGGYAWFNRFPVETEDGGTVWAGRITLGGRHAALSLNASATMAEYDVKTVAAHVRAYEDEHGIVVAGVIEPNLTASERVTLDRRKVSGDWRETPGGLSLVEVLALSPGPRAHAEPGFPVPGTFSHNGRQTALTAALGPDAGPQTLTFRRGDALVDVDALAAALERRQEERAARAEAAAELAAMIEGERVAARFALEAEVTGLDFREE
jgi:hypothetical protein